MALPANLATGDLINETWVDAVVDTITPTAWATITYASGWADLNTATYGPPLYRKVGDVVQIRGIAARAAINAVGTTVFTLPVGFRPLVTTFLGTIDGWATPGGARLDITTDGVVKLGVGSNTANEWVNLAGTFYLT